jgi:hypothetical protein
MPHFASISRRTKLWLIWFFVVFGVLNVSVRDDEDIRRYFAYAEATLGHPYAADLVRPPDEAGFKGAPDPTRMATPTRPLVPWRDFFVEYPPAMIIPALAPAIFTSNWDVYFVLFNLEMEIALTLAVWLVVNAGDRLRLGAGSDTLAHAILLTLALGAVAVRRYDPCVALAIAASVRELARGKPALSGVALGIATALKGVPILLAPIFAIYALSRGDRGGLARGAAGCALTIGLCGLAYAAIAGPHVWDAFAYHHARPLGIGTVYAGLLMLAGNFDPAIVSFEFAYGSYSLVSPVEPVLRAFATVLMIAGVSVSWFYAYRRLTSARDDADRLLAVVASSLVCLIAFMTLGKFVSSQYCVWLIPLAALIAPFSSRSSRSWLPLGFLLIQIEYPLLFHFLYARLNLATSAVILLRTLCLWLFVAATVKSAPPHQEYFEKNEVV